MSNKYVFPIKIHEYITFYWVEFIWAAGLQKTAVLSAWNTEVRNEVGTATIEGNPHWEQGPDRLSCGGLYVPALFYTEAFVRILRNIAKKLSDTVFISDLYFFLNKLLMNRPVFIT